MKSLTLFLLLAVMAVILSSGCLSDQPQKKAVTPLVTATTPVTPVTLPPSASATATLLQTPVIPPVVSAPYDDRIVSETVIEAPNLRILKYNEARPEVGKLTITGIAKNEGKTSVPHAEVQIKFYDANNNVIAISKASTDNFDPGSTWGFSIEYPGQDSGKVKSYKVTVTPV